MAKEQNAGTKKAQKAKNGKGKRSTPKAQKKHAAKHASVVKAVRDAEAIRDQDAAVLSGARDDVSADTSDVSQPPKRGPGPQKGDANPGAETKCQEKVKKALDYRRTGHTYREVAEAMGCAPSTARKWAEEDVAAIPRESAKVVLANMLDQCDMIMSKLMPALDDTAPKDIVKSVLKVQNQILRTVPTATWRQ